MDPNQALLDLRAALTDYRRATTLPAVGNAAGRLADASEAIDGWLATGGFLAADWVSAFPTCS